MSSDIKICNSALLLCGGSEISSFSDETREALLCSALYENTRDMLLYEHYWRFSLAQVLLSRLSATPLYGYQYAHQVPSDALRMKSVETSAKYEVFQDKLYCDLSAVNCVYQRKVTSSWNEAFFPVYFNRALELELASILSVALSGDEGKAGLYKQLAIANLKRARTIDSQQQPNGAVRESNFIFTEGRG